MTRFRKCIQSTQHYSMTVLMNQVPELVARRAYDHKPMHVQHTVRRDGRYFYCDRRFVRKLPNREGK
jgi:hypothetical protein